MFSSQEQHQPHHIIIRKLLQVITKNAEHDLNKNLEHLSVVNHTIATNIQHYQQQQHHQHSQHANFINTLSKKTKSKLYKIRIRIVFII